MVPIVVLAVVVVMALIMAVVVMVVAEVVVGRMCVVAAVHLGDILHRRPMPCRGVFHMISLLLLLMLLLPWEVGGERRGAREGPG